MGVHLTPEQWSDLKSSAQQPARIAGPGDEGSFVLIPEAVYLRFQAVFEAVPPTPEERRFQLQEFGRRAGWDDPSMDIYEDLDPRRT